MGLVYLPTWMVDLYGFHVALIYQATHGFLWIPMVFGPHLWVVKQWNIPNFWGLTLTPSRPLGKKGVKNNQVDGVILKKVGN